MAELDVQSSKRVALEDRDTDGATYTIRPMFEKKFRPVVVREIIGLVLKEILTDKLYNSEEAKLWTREISDSLQNKLIELQLERYKYAVHIVLGEQRGEGVRMGCRCFWDSDTDSYAQDIYMNVLVGACLNMDCLVKNKKKQ